MKIITWNCNMAFRKKAHLIFKDNPDLLIIQECEHTEKFKNVINAHLDNNNRTLLIGDFNSNTSGIDQKE